MTTTHSPSQRERLHEQLKDFYNREGSYFDVAHEVNSDLTPERAYVLSRVKPGDLVLDVGCGPSDNGRHVIRHAQYVGSDLSSIALHMARAAVPAGVFALSESHSLPFATGSFDVVLSTYALEHFVFPKESLDEMWRVCRPGGEILLLSPAYDDPRQLPPSVGDWSVYERLWIVLHQGWRQLRRHMDMGYCAFACIVRPRILRESYQSDFDAVHLVSAREIANFFKGKGGEILFERKRKPRPVSGGSIWRRLRERLRNILLFFGIGEYAGLNLQIAVMKDETNPEARTAVKSNSSQMDSEKIA